MRPSPIATVHTCIAASLVRWVVGIRVLVVLLIQRVVNDLKGLGILGRKADNVRNPSDNFRDLRNKNSHRVGPNIGSKFRPLIGILSQKAEPSRAIWAKLVKLTCGVWSCGSQAKSLVLPSDCRPPVPESVVTPARRIFGAAWALPGPETAIFGCQAPIQKPYKTDLLWKR
jgi:hypothetical protein